MGIHIALAFGVLSLVGACSNCDDEIEAARQFLDNPANLSCTTDADCVVVSTGCHTFTRGICGQAQVSRTASESAAWRALSQDLSDCQGNGCAQCLAALIPRCENGRCGGTP